MSHTVLTLQVMWRHGGRRIEAGTLDRVDRSPRDQHQNTCLKICLSSTLDVRHVAERGAPIVIGRLQLFTIGGTTRSSDFHRTAAISRDGSIVDRDPIFIRRQRIVFVFSLSSRESGASDSNLTAAKTGGRTVRSRPDRTAIAARSSRDRAPSAAKSPPDDRRSPKTKIMARSRRDRGPIAARSCQKSCLFRSKIEAHSPRN